VAVSGGKPSPRWNHSAVVLSGGEGTRGGGGGRGGGAAAAGKAVVIEGCVEVAVFGGWTRRTPKEFFNDVHVLRLAWEYAFDRHRVCSCRWSTLRTSGVPPSPRAQACAWLGSQAEGANAQRGWGKGSSRAVSRRLLFVFGGASHATVEPPADGTLEEGVPYGTLVVDHEDLHCLDLDTKAWVRCSGGGFSGNFVTDRSQSGNFVANAAHRFRGGVNSVVVLNEEDMEEEGSESDLGQRVYISGGMHSEPGAVMPDFLKEVVEVCVNVRGQHLGFD
jgi:hypothetical protein